MSGFLAIIGRDLKLAARVGGDVLTLLLFFVSVAAIVPFAIGPDKAELARLAPGIVWIAALLSALLGLDRLFRADHEDGSLQAFAHAATPFSAIVFAKIVAHWLMTAVPLMLATPLVAVLLNMDMATLLRTELSLLLGTPALMALGAIGAAVTVPLRRGGLIAPVLILPLSVPQLIFGVAAIGVETPDLASPALMFLAGLSLMSVTIGPFVAALALRMGTD